MFPQIKLVPSLTANSVFDSTFNNKIKSIFDDVMFEMTADFCFCFLRYRKVIIQSNIKVFFLLFSFAVSLKLISSKNTSGCLDAAASVGILSPPTARWQECSGVCVGFLFGSVVCVCG